MVKRGRDEVGTGTGVFGFPPESSYPSSERTKTALAHVKHLNTEYLKDLTRKIAENPYCWHEKEAESYKKYARRIRVRPVVCLFLFRRNANARGGSPCACQGNETPWVSFRQVKKSQAKSRKCFHSHPTV